MAIDTPKRTSRKGIPNHPIEFRWHLAKLACEPDVSVARLAMEHGVNSNLVFKWRRALLAGEYDPVDLLPVTVEAPAQEIEQPAPAPVASAAPAGAKAAAARSCDPRVAQPHAAGADRRATTGTPAHRSGRRIQYALSVDRKSVV